MTKPNMLTRAITAAGSALGLQKNAAPPAVPEPPKKSAPGPDPTPSEQLQVWTAPVKNRTLLIAYKPGTDPTNPNNLVSVRVRSNHNYVAHMRVRVRLVQGTVYDLVGPLPRWRGKM